MPRPLAPLTLTEDERSELLGWARRPTTAQAHALRARIILNSAEGLSNEEVADELGVSSVTVGKWRKCFCVQISDSRHELERSTRETSAVDEVSPMID